jgi:DNA-binding response OmpR family regulator
MNTVLIIDDNPVITSIYRGKLAAEGLHTEIALNGEEGLLMLDRCKPDVVLLDLMLPKVNGMDVLRRIRARPEHETLPVIVFSNSYSPEIMQQAWGFGATDVLHKSSTTPRNVVLALVRAIATRKALTGAPVAVAAESRTVDMASTLESRMTALLQKFAAGDMGSSAEFNQLIRGEASGHAFAAPMVKLFTAIEMLVTMADQAVAGPARELCHDSIRAIARVCRQHLSAAEGGLLSPVAVAGGVRS